METLTPGDLILDLAVAFQTGIGHALGESSVALCTSILTPQTELSLVNRREGAGGGSVEIDDCQQKNRGDGEEDDPESRCLESHPALPPEKKNAP